MVSKRNGLKEKNLVRKLITTTICKMWFASIKTDQWNVQADWNMRFNLMLVMYKYDSYRDNSVFFTNEW